MALIFIGYADNVAAIIVARNIEEAKSNINQLIIRIKSWLTDKGLTLARDKKELIYL